MIFAGQTNKSCSLELNHPLTKIYTAVVVSEIGTCRTNRVHGMDAGWSPEAFKVSRVERR